MQKKILTTNIFKNLLHSLRPNAPQNVTGVLDEEGAISLNWDAVNDAKAYVVHYSNANESDPHKAIFMGYSETNDWSLSTADVPELQAGDKIYLYVQTFKEVGVGSNDIEKSAYLNENKLGSDWSEPVILTKE